MLALSSQLQQLRSSRKQIAGKIEAIKRQIQFENRPNSQYTASGLKRNRDEKDDDKTRRSSTRSDDLPDVSEPLLKMPKLSSIASQVQPDPVASTDEPGLDAPSSAADAEMTDSAAATEEPTDILAQAPPKKRSRQTDMIRNRRMFGALLGHLNKAKENITEEKQAEKAQRRATLEQHVQERIQSDTAQNKEEKLKQLNEEMEREKTNLNETMEKLVQAENKLKAARLVERHIRNAGLIQTTSDPFIFWKPRIHTSRTKNMLLRSRKKTKEALRETIAKWGFTSVEELEELLKVKQQPLDGDAKKVVSKRDKDRDDAGEDHSSNDEDVRDKENDEDQGGEQVHQEVPDTVQVTAEDAEHQPEQDAQPIEEANKEGVVVVVGEIEPPAVDESET